MSNVIVVQPVLQPVEVKVPGPQGPTGNGAYTLLHSTNLVGVVGPDRIYINNISQDYRILQLVIENFKCDNPDREYLYIRFNEDEAAHYSNYDVNLYSELWIQYPQSNIAGTYNCLTLTLTNYTSTASWKMGVLDATATNYNVNDEALSTTLAPICWTNTAPITSMKIFVNNPSIALEGGTVKLYGLK
jgi:hypothetical protein